MLNSNLIIKKIDLYELLELYQDEKSSFAKNYQQGLYSYLNLGYGYTDGTFLVIIDETSKFIAGIIQYDKNPHREEITYAMMFVSIVPEYQNQGWASKLIEAMIIDLKNKVKNIEISSYSSQGEKLASTVSRLAHKYEGEINLFHRVFGQEYQNALIKNKP